MTGSKKTKTEREKRSKENLKSMSLLAHIEELRKRLFYIVIGLVICFFICIDFADDIFVFLSIPVDKVLGKAHKLVFTTVQGPFVLYMKVALLGGFFLALPWIFYHLWKFIAPALYKCEKKMITPFVFFTSISFLGGAAFGYYVMFPYTFKFLIGLGKNFTPMLTVDEYLSLVLKMLLALGCIFELPMIIYFFSKLGLLTHRFLLKNYHWAIVICLIVGAILSPPDVFSQILVSVPLILLYTLSIAIAWAVTKRKNREKG